MASHGHISPITLHGHFERDAIDSTTSSVGKINQMWLLYIVYMTLRRTVYLQQSKVSVGLGTAIPEMVNYICHPSSDLLHCLTLGQL